MSVSVCVWFGGGDCNTGRLQSGEEQRSREGGTRERKWGSSDFHERATEYEKIEKMLKKHQEKCKIALVVK